MANITLINNKLFLWVPHWQGTPEGVMIYEIRDEAMDKVKEWYKNAPNNLYSLLLFSDLTPAFTYRRYIPNSSV